MQFVIRLLCEMWDKYKCDSCLSDIQRSEVDEKYSCLFCFTTRKQRSMKAYGRMPIKIHVYLGPVVLSLH